MFQGSDLEKGRPDPGVGHRAERGEDEMKISRDVIQQVANQTLLGVIGVRAADTEGKDKDAVKIDVTEGPVPSIRVDTAIKVKYGLRISDIAWYVQESIKRGLEQNTGYTVEEVNVFVKGLYRE